MKKNAPELKINGASFKDQANSGTNWVICLLLSLAIVPFQTI